jgi:hypothetical protein
MREIDLYPLRFHDKWVLIDQHAKILHLDVEPVFIQDSGEGTFFIETATGMGLVDSGLNWLIKTDTQLFEKKQYSYHKINEGLLSRFSFYTEGLSVAVNFDGQYGFIDKQGNWVIKPEYHSAVRFSEGLASVMKDGLWGAIDSSGQLIIDFKFASQFFFMNGMATVYRKNSKHCGGLIDKTGKMLIEEQFADNKGFSEGLMPASKTKNYGYYDLSGKAVFPEIFERANLFQNGKAVVSFKGKYGMIDKEGNFIIQPVFDYIGYFADGIAMAQVGSKYGFIDITGKLVIAPVFDQVEYLNKQGLAKVLVKKLFTYSNEPITIFNNYFHYINLDGNFVHPEKPDYDIISVEQWEQENPEIVASLAVKEMYGLSEYIYLNETVIKRETENTLNKREQTEKTIETELRPLKFKDLIKVPYFMVNVVSAIIFGFNCSIYSPIEYPQVWHRFIFMGIFGLFGYISGKTFAEIQYIEGKNFSWKNREGIIGGLLVLMMGLGYFIHITSYLYIVFTWIDLICLVLFFFTAGMALGNIFRRMASELVPSCQRGLLLFVLIVLVSNFIMAFWFTGYSLSPHVVLGISALIALPLGIVWIFLSSRKPEYQGATSLWNAFYFGSNSASVTTRSFYKKNYTEKDFKEWEEKNTTYSFDGDERSIAASRGGVGVFCIFFTNLVILSSPWFLAVLIKRLYYFF